MTRELALSCPVAHGDTERVQLAHGGGGRAMEHLLESIIRPAFDDAALNLREDGAILNIAGPVAFSTDSYVVRPLQFPGGDIGKLAINGTVNDLAMCGARPLYLSVSFILEEGLPLDTFRTIVGSMRDAARSAGVRLVTGDTKVVDHGKADGMFVNTSGIGEVVARTPVGPQHVRVGDVVVLSGDLGRHGIAVMMAREALGFETAIDSDCAALTDPMFALLNAGIEVHCLRDLTRGGLASAVVEIAETAGVSIALEEMSIPVSAEVGAACELLGLDPMHVANEGRFIAFVIPNDAQRAVQVLRACPVSSGAAIIGEVQAAGGGCVSCRGPLGVARAIDMLSGEQLPRIC